MRLYPLLFLLLLVAGALAVLVGSGDLTDPELRDTFLKLRGYRLAAAFLAARRWRSAASLYRACSATHLQALRCSARPQVRASEGKSPCSLTGLPVSAAASSCLR